MIMLNSCGWSCIGLDIGDQYVVHYVALKVLYCANNVALLIWNMQNIWFPHHVASYSLVDIGSDNVVLPDGTNSLPELTYPAIHLRAISQKLPYE